MNPYATEKTLISKSIQRLSNFKSTFKYLNEEIKEREKASQTFLTELPPLMASLFDQLDELVIEADNRFQDKILHIVRNQQRTIQDNIRTKLP